MLPRCNLFRRGETQALRIEEWAKAVGVWIDDIDESFTNAFGERIAEGGEAIVYDHGATLVKTRGYRLTYVRQSS